MDVNGLLKGVDCACGKKHSCRIEHVYIENGAIARLTTLCAAYSHILLVADENTFAAAGDKVQAALADKPLRKVLFSGASVLIPNESAIATVQAALDSVDLIVGIGSGVIQDLCKYVSHTDQVPYMIVATAPSMDGYASDGAAMITDGMKVTYPAGLPLAIVADTAVLKEAPLDMIRSGYGDILGKFSALNDWKLSQLINGEYFCTYIYDLTYAQITRTIEVADSIMRRDEASIGKLMEALVVIGILMSFAGSSRPASGSEHHLSHFFEITGILDHTDYLPHGTDVAYATLVTAKLREQICSRTFPHRLYRQSAEAYENAINAVYKSSASGCIALQEKVGNYRNDRSQRYWQEETAIKSILAQMPSADRIAQLLGDVGFDVDAFYAFYGEEKIKTAIRYAKDLKDRYTVLWLYYDLFGDLE